MKNIIALIFVNLLFGQSYSQNFTLVDSVPEGAYGTAAWGDFNNDGFKDLVYISQVFPDAACKVYTFNGTTFSEVNQQFPLLYNPGACWGDLDNDGFDDLVVNGLDSALNAVTYIYQSVGNGTFVPVANAITGLSAGGVDITDYNNDGWNDIAVTGYGNAGGEAYIYKNTGGFNFTNINTPLMGIHFGDVKWGDMNNDGLQDLLINGIEGLLFRARIYLNMGQDSFQLQNIYMKGSGGTADWCDFDNDGWQDILIAGYDSTSVHNFTELHHNNQDGTFTIILNALPEFGEPVATDIADFNNDGKPDVCFMGGTNFSLTYSALCLNQGNNQFNWQPFLPALITNCIVTAADYDNDGDADLFYGESFLRNDGLTSIEANQDSYFIKIFPQPVSNYLTIETSQTVKEISIVDIQGRELTAVKAGIKKVDVSALKNGLYVAILFFDDGKEIRQKFIVE